MENKFKTLLLVLLFIENIINSIYAMEFDFDLSKTKKLPNDYFDDKPQYKNFIRGNREANFTQKFYDGQSIDVIPGDISNALNRQSRMMQSLAALDDDATISDDLNSIYKDGKGPRVFDKGQGVYVPNVFVSYNVNNNETVRVNFQNLNSQYGTDIYVLQGMFKDEEIMTSGHTYYMNYSLSDNIIYSREYTSTYNSAYEDDYIAKCNYTSYPMTFSHKKLTGYNFYQSVTFRLGAFVLQEDKIGVYHMIMSNNELSIESIKPYITNDDSGVDVDTTTFSNIFVIDQPYEDDTFLVLQTSNGELLIYGTVVNDRDRKSVV